MENNRSRDRVGRERVYEEILSRGDATTAELAAATGLHENTVRGHLDRLDADGRIRSRQDPPAGRGRPRRRWSVTDPTTIGPYAGMATALAGSLARAGATAAELARAAGADWGERLVEGRTARDARSLVVDVMREQGFAPDDAEPAIRLRRCPLRAAATRYPEVVCAVHAGMIEGIARTIDASTAAELEPHAAPSPCILRLRTAI